MTRFVTHQSILAFWLSRRLRHLRQLHQTCIKKYALRCFACVALDGNWALAWSIDTFFVAVESNVNRWTVNVNKLSACRQRAVRIQLSPLQGPGRHHVVELGLICRGYGEGWAQLAADGLTIS